MEIFYTRKFVKSKLGTSLLHHEDNIKPFYEKDLSWLISWGVSFRFNGKDLFIGEE